VGRPVPAVPGDAGGAVVYWNLPPPPVYSDAAAWGDEWWEWDGTADPEAGYADEAFVDAAPERFPGLLSLVLTPSFPDAPPLSVG
jgi:hypothetical protein